jgi:hypothetical protein
VIATFGRFSDRRAPQAGCCRKAAAAIAIRELTIAFSWSA